MVYISNAWVAKVRRCAVNDVLLRGIPKAQVARKYGVHRATIGKWLKRHEGKRMYIDTQSSRPHTCPHKLSSALVERVIQLRRKVHRCAPVLHALLQKEGVIISLSSVERILRRHKLTRTKKKLQSPHMKIERPYVTFPGDLVELDTIHFVKSNYSRFFIYAAIDLYSRMGYAEFQPRLSAQHSFCVVKRTHTYFNFPISVIQTDNGAEFSEQLYLKLHTIGIGLRHTRVGRPNDNAHIERFIRTIQEECFGSKLPKEKYMKETLREYITYYNSSRPHLALNCQTPSDTCCQGLEVTTMLEGQKSKVKSQNHNSKVKGFQITLNLFLLFLIQF